MNTRLVNWDRFIELTNLRKHFESRFVAKGFKPDEVHDVVFDVFFNACCRKITHVEYKWVYYDVLKKLTMWMAKSRYKPKTKATNNHKFHFNRIRIARAFNLPPVGFLNDFDMARKVYLAEIDYTTPADICEKKDLRYVFFKELTTFDERKQAIVKLFFNGEEGPDIAKKVKLTRERCFQVRKQVLDDMKKALEEKYGRAY